MATEEPAREVEPRIEAYRFHEREWDGYGELYDAFEWEIPTKFNAATYCCDRWAEADPDRVAAALPALKRSCERLLRRALVEPPVRGG